MSSNTLQLNQCIQDTGLGTSTFTVVTAGEYTVAVQYTLPPASGLEIVINHNGSSVYTIGGSSTNPSATQPSIGGGIKLACAATDTITVVLSSSNAVDSLPNAVKGTINVYQTI